MGCVMLFHDMAAALKASSSTHSASLVVAAAAALKASSSTSVPTDAEHACSIACRKLCQRIILKSM